MKMFGGRTFSEHSQAHKSLLRLGLQTWLRGFDTQVVEDSWESAVSNQTLAPLETRH